MKVKPFQIVPIDFQLKASETLLERSLFYRDNPQVSNVFVLKMPTGSGKTLTDYLYVLSLFKADPKAVVFFTTVGQGDIHLQACSKFKMYSDQKMNCLAVNEMMTLKHIKAHSVFFMNWESLNKTKKDSDEVISIFGKEYHESKTTYPMICEMIRKAGLNPYLIVDESQLSVSTEKSEFIIKQLNPIIQINQSATPSMIPTTQSDYFEVSLKQAQDAKLIVKGFKFQEGFKKNQVITLDLMIKQSLALSQNLENLSINENKHFIPLIGIQLPNGSESTIKLKELKTILEKENITEENGTLFIHLDEEKTNHRLSELDSPNSKVKVLIFKQAIATGWDCTRAKIWVKLRDIKKESFNIQTGGRFLRTVFTNYFDNDKLNYAYLFTDQDNYDYDESLFSPSKEYAPSLEIEIDQELKLENYSLLNSFNSRQNNYGDYKSDISNHVFDKFLLSLKISKSNSQDDNLKLLEDSGFDLNLNNVRSIIGNKTVNVDEFLNSQAQDNSAKLTFQLSENEPTFKLKSLFKVDYCHDFSFERSWKAFLGAVNKIAPLFFKDNCIYNFHCLLSNNSNWEKFVALTKNDLVKYQKNRKSSLSKETVENIFLLHPKREVSSLNNTLVPVVNSVYGVNDNKKWVSCVIASKRGDKHSDSQVEQDFFNYWNSICFQDLKDSKVFLFRNGTNTEQDLRIPYLNPQTKIEAGFFPDLILIKKTAKGFKTCIFDIKHENDLKTLNTEDSVYAKHQALQNYINTYSCEENQISGGLLVQIKGSSGLSFFRVFSEELNLLELNKGDYSSGQDFASFIKNSTKLKKVA